MISVDVIGSGSKGNCYVVDNGNSRLMLECGLPWAQIKKALNFKTDNIVGILVTHEHQDHAKAVKDAASAGMEIYLSEGTAGAIEVIGSRWNHRLNYLRSGEQLQIGEWCVVPFKTVHDAAEPLGFVIASGGEKLLFLTDSAYCQYRFSGITKMMLECNFSNEILEENITAGRIDGNRRKRLLNSHFSLDRVKDLIIANDTSSLQEIWLMHLSDLNSNEKQFKKEVQQVAGVPVHVCTSGIRV